MNLEIVRKHQKAFSVLVVVFIVLFAIGMFLIQQALDTSQDIRQQASVSSGQVQVALVPTQPGQIQLGQPSYIELGINTNNLQTNGVQLKFDLQGAVSNFSFEPIANVGFGQPLINTAITGNAGEVAFLPNDIAGSFSSSSSVAFIRINFTPTAAGDITLSFDPLRSVSTVANSNPPQDELNTIEPIVISVVAPSPTPSPSPSPSVIPNPTPSPVASPTPQVSVSPSPSPSVSVLPSPSVIPSPSPIASASPSPTATATPIASTSPSPTTIASPSPSPETSPQVCANNPDLNDDARVDLADYSQLATNFMQTGQDLVGDIDCNGRVDLADYSILSQNFTL
jgi:hypothetical protein